MNAEKLAEYDAKINSYADLSRPFLQSVLVMHRGELLSEHYWRGFAPSSYQPIYSITKSVVSMLIGLALTDGKLSLNDSLAQWFPEMDFAPGAETASITIEHLLTMSAGFQEMKGRSASSDPLAFLLKRPTAYAPGTQFRYASEDLEILVALLERAVGEAAIEYAVKRLFTPLGIWQGVRKSERKRLWKTNKQGRIKGGLGLHLRSPELASLGQLYLQGGRWQEQQLLSADYITASTSAQIDGGYPEQVRYGYLCWVTHDREGRQAFFASGAGGQYVYMLPALELVIVITSTLKNMDGRPHRVMITRFVSDLLAEA